VLGNLLLLLEVLLVPLVLLLPLWVGREKRREREERGGGHVRQHAEIVGQIMR
jgi:hypothetical protein